MSGPYNRPPMPLLGNSRVLGTTGGTTQLMLAPNQVVQVAEWTTDEAEAQELELLAWPLSGREGAPNGYVDASIMTKTVLQLTAAHGGCGVSGVSVETRLALPANGLRYRFRAKQAKLTIRGAAATDVGVMLAAAIYPVAGDTGAESCIELTPQDALLGMGAPRIPKGARAFRCSVGSLDSNAKVRFFDLASNQVGGDIVAAMVNDWMDIPRGAHSLNPGVNWTQGGEPYNYGAAVYFRV